MENEEKVNNFKSGLRKVIEVRSNMILEGKGSLILEDTLQPMIDNLTEAIRELKAMLPESEV